MDREPLPDEQVVRGDVDGDFFQTDVCDALNPLRFTIRQNRPGHFCMTP